MSNKQYIWEAMSEPAQDGQLYWWTGYKLVLAADQVLIYAAGHKAFRIDLSLSRETVQSLVQQALILKPGDPASAQALAAYKLNIHPQRPTQLPQPRMHPPLGLPGPPLPGDMHPEYPQLRRTSIHHQQLQQQPTHPGAYGGYPAYVPRH